MLLLVLLSLMVGVEREREIDSQGSFFRSSAVISVRPS